MTDDRPLPSRRKSRLLLAIAGFFFFVPPLAVGIVLYRSFDRPPDLAVDLPSSPEARRAAFRARIDAAFPPGSPEAALVATLKEQGFVLTQAEDAAWPHRAAAAVEKMTCTTTYEIKWRGDGAGKLDAVAADIVAPCP